jgi:hypothetical protein
VIVRANAKPNAHLKQIVERYVVDNELNPKDLTGAGAQKVLEHANAQVRTTSGDPAFAAAELDVVREVLMDSMSAVVDAMGRSSQSLRDASSTQGVAPGFGGRSSVGSPAYARFNLEPKADPQETLAQLVSGDGEQAVFQRLGDALERHMAAEAGANPDPYERGPSLDDLVKNRTFAQGLVELVAQESPGDLGDAMKAIGQRAGPEVAKYKESWGEDLEVYQQTQAPRPKSEPELTALRNALELAAIDVRMLEMPVENIFRSEGGRAAFASFVKDIVGQSEVSKDRRQQFQDELNEATPLELKPMLYSRVELGETLAGEAIDKGDLDELKSLMNSSEQLRALGAFRKVEQLLDEGAPGAKDLGKLALDIAQDRGASKTAARLEAALSE